MTSWRLWTRACARGAKVWGEVYPYAAGSTIAKWLAMPGIVIVSDGMPVQARGRLGDMSITPGKPVTKQ